MLGKSKKALKVFFGFITVLSGTAFGAESYIVKRNQTLSAIAHEFYPGPVYKKKGSLQQVLDLNPEIENPDLIYVGEKIRLENIAPVLSRKNTPARAVASEETPQPEATSSAVSSPAPILASAPAATPDDVAHRLTFGLGYHFKTFNMDDLTNGTTAKLMTSSDLEFDVGWTQNWSKSFSTFFNFGFEKLNFEPSDNSLKSIDHGQQSPAHFVLGFDLALSDRVHFRTIAAYGQELFGNSNQGNGIAIDSIYVPKVSETIVLTLVQMGSTEVGIEGEAGYLFRSSGDGYTVNSGYLVDGGLFINQNFGSHNQDSLKLLLNYGSLNQNTSLIHQNVKDTSALVMFSMPIFGGSEK